MAVKDSDSDQSKAKLLNWIFVLAIALVACAIGWVGWTCVDSVQKKAGKLENYHVTPENTKVTSRRYDVLNKDIDNQIMANQLSPDLALQDSMAKLEGSEIPMNMGTKAVDKQQFAQAEKYFSEALELIPAEAKQKDSWRVGGLPRKRQSYTAYGYEERSYCYLKAGDYTKALADLTMAIKLHPEQGLNYENRAKVYFLLGKKSLGAADLQMARTLAQRGAIAP
jgi:tetratricopeptide (TPR) repeat protein